MAVPCASESSAPGGSKGDGVERAEVEAQEAGEIHRRRSSSGKGVCGAAAGGGDSIVKKIVDLLELQYGTTKLIVQQILDRIAVD